MASAEQLHIAYGSVPDAMTVAWATKDNATGSLLLARYGLIDSNPLSWHEAAADNRVMGGYTKHRTTLTGLVSGARYAYECEGSDGAFVSSTFVARRTDPDWSPRIVMFGDLGWTNDQVRMMRGHSNRQFTWGISNRACQN